MGLYIEYVRARMCVCGKLCGLQLLKEPHWKPKTQQVSEWGDMISITLPGL
jgi:hypothetical protein